MVEAVVSLPAIPSRVGLALKVALPLIWFGVTVALILTLNTVRAERNALADWQTGVVATTATAAAKSGDTGKVTAASVQARIEALATNGATWKAEAARLSDANRVASAEGEEARREAAQARQSAVEAQKGNRAAAATLERYKPESGAPVLSQEIWSRL